MGNGSGKFVAFFVGLIGLVASVVGIYTFLTGNSSVGDLIPTNTPTALAATPTVVLPTTSAIPTADLPNPIPTSTRPPAAVSGVLASYPTQRNLQTLPNIWSKNKLDFGDMTSPGTQEYQVDGKATDRLIWNFTWCAVDQAWLDEILEPLSVEFLIGDVQLRDDVVRQYEESNRKSGERCRVWATKLTDWEGGKRIKLTIQYDLVEAVNDGRQEYARGRYSHIIWVAIDN